MADEMVDGLGEKPYIPILDMSDNLVRQALEKQTTTGSRVFIPKIWQPVLEKNLRYHATNTELLRKQTAIKPRRTPLPTRIKNNLAEKLRVLATKLDGWAPQDADWYD